MGDSWSLGIEIAAVTRKQEGPKRGAVRVPDQDVIVAAGAFLLGDSWSSLLQPWEVQIQ